MLWTRRVFCEVSCCRVCVCVCVCDCNVKAQRSVQRTVRTVPTVTQKFAITHRYTTLQQSEKCSQILNTSKLQQVMILRSIRDLLCTNCLAILESQCDELCGLWQIGVSWPLCSSWAKKKRIFLTENTWTVSISQLGGARCSESHILIKSVKNLYSCFLHLSFRFGKIRCKKYARNAVEIFEFPGNRLWNAALFLWATNEIMPTI